ncbi:DNA-3-methyladenine glycosylase I [Hyphobacterium sp. HN65]|uniref:DNA-3-methyladenine glycosylase I n=1 Tax=Hyphobacterium lacteum TaxID=3116575 RepID=A0ABU7LQW7_9PROT|nr:DNA-3-methyladenine glycosylase I [Hyphobacterium sp. HN65]MEE2526297.1 DNA-3-methyladenine glycosylase I [Hyphobacterium sp. HN65]
MRAFSEIEALAIQHHGSEEAVEAKLGRPKSAEQLASIPDDRWLSGMTRAVFSAGFVWKVIEAKWDGFEAAFDGFDPGKVALYSDDDIARLASDERIVRNGQKITATVRNAQFVQEIAGEHGGFGAFVANWPASDQIGLLDVFAKRGSRLGGATGQYVLRFAGWDAFIASGDVVKALVREGVIDKPPTSKGGTKRVQDAFNHWTEETGRSQTEISRILALSVG